MASIFSARCRERAAPAHNRRRKIVRLRTGKLPKRISNSLSARTNQGTKRGSAFHRNDDVASVSNGPSGNFRILTPGKYFFTTFFRRVRSLGHAGIRVSSEALVSQPFSVSVISIQSKANT